jgi:hypothetical protein
MYFSCGLEVKDYNCLLTNEAYASIYKMLKYYYWF